MTLLADLKKEEKILFGLLVAFFITLYFAHLSSINSILTGMIVVYSFFIGSLQDKWETLKQRKYIQGMLLFFLVLVISTLISDDVARGFHHLKIRLPLLVFPASIGLLSLRDEFKGKVLVTFATLTTIICFLCLVYAIDASDFFKRPEFLYNDSLSYFIRQQSIYVALAVNLSIYIFANIIFFKRSSHKFSMLIAVLFLYGISYLLASRIMFALLIFATLAFSFYYVIHKRKYLEGITLLLGLGIGIMVVNKTMPKTFNRYKELGYTSFDYKSMGKESHYNMEITPDQWNGANFRLAAWSCGWELVKVNFLKGVDLGDKEKALTEKYQEKNFQFAIKTEKNVHSNYLDILYSVGIIGFFAYLFSWLILPFISALKSGNVLGMVFILTFAIAWTTEVYFGRTFGVMLVGFFLPFMLIDENKKSPL
ncbi:O-antigen ligase family protein [Sabulibacter ruber]|uniref:O-antigen ligase family protein n=1 Tax=Sabulibacter ruber TaxID=2811901 RepID=UPI001A96B577|nr:O-antigen ligase family protein [Sabulibacter ruber]